MIFKLLFVTSLFIANVLGACTWINVCPTSKSGKNVQSNVKIFKPGNVSNDIIQRSLGSCIMDGKCSPLRGNTVNCEVNKEWKSTRWSGHYEVCYNGGSKYQCFSSQWKSADYYKC